MYNVIVPSSSAPLARLEKHAWLSYKYPADSSLSTASLKVIKIKIKIKIKISYFHIKYKLKIQFKMQIKLDSYLNTWSTPLEVKQSMLQEIKINSLQWRFSIDWYFALVQHVFPTLCLLAPVTSTANVTAALVVGSGVVYDILFVIVLVYRNPTSTGGSIGMCLWSTCS